VDELSVPARIGAYAVAARVGVGGEGMVFRAGAPNGRPVAVKIRHRDRAEEPFDEEFELAERVGTSITAAPVEHGRSGLGAFLVTTWLDGYQRLRPTRDRERLWRLSAAVAERIAATTAAGVVHCDVKPDNLMIRGEDVRLIDFGIARDARCQMSWSRYVHCSRGWAAPEQLSGDPVTPAADVFAWGCVTAYLATGVTPFAGRTEREWIMRLRSSVPDLVGLPAGLADMVAAALSPRPQWRPSAAEIAAFCHYRRHIGRATVHLTPLPCAA
jgi:serine/threonine protein kinase